jgi:hypothetical protein
MSQRHESESVKKQVVKSWDCPSQDESTKGQVKEKERRKKEERDKSLTVCTILYASL